GGVNVADSVRGVQIGVVNVARDADIAIGLINVTYGEPIRLVLTANEWFPLNAAVKFGSKMLYSELQLGYAIATGRTPARWAGGYGLGVHLWPDRLVSLRLELLGGGYFYDTADIGPQLKGGLFASLSGPVVLPLLPRLGLGRAP